MATPDFVNLQSPTLTVQAGALTELTFGQIFEAGLTESAGADPTIVAQLGYGPLGSDPETDTSWTWIDATFNGQVGDNDEYRASFTAPLTGGQYAYTYRFAIDDGVNPLTFTYGDLDGNGENAGLSFDPNQLGTLTVTGSPTIDFSDNPGGLKFDFDGSGDPTNDSAATNLSLNFDGAGGQVQVNGATSDLFFPSILEATGTAETDVELAIGTDSTDSFTVTAPHFPLTLEGRAGEDNFQMDGASGVTILGGDQQDSVNLIGANQIRYDGGADDSVSLNGDTLSFDNAIDNSFTISGGAATDGFWSAESTSTAGDSSIALRNVEIFSFRGEGNDTISITGDYTTGLDGDLTIDAGAGVNTITVESFVRVIVYDTFGFTPTSDTIVLTGGDSFVQAFGGNDTIDTGESGATNLDFDTISYGISSILGNPQGLTVDLRVRDSQGYATITVTNSDNSTQTDLAKNFEELWATVGNDSITVDDGLVGRQGLSVTSYAGADILVGANGANRFDGGSGNDTLDGGAGDDTLFGGFFNFGSELDTSDNDLLTGGAGNDLIYGDHASPGPAPFAGNVDTAVFSGSWADYDIVTTTELGIAGFQLTHARNTGATNDGQDRVFQVEQFQFADRTLSAADLLTGGTTVPTTTATITNVTETTANSASSTSLTVSGTLSAALVSGEVVKVYDGLTYLGNATVNGTTWSYANGSTTAGSHTFNVQVENATGPSATSSVSVIAGNTGATTLTGTNADEYLFGFAGNDTITGGPGGDTINAGGGDDIINNFIGADHVDGGAGTADTLVLNTTTDLATATDGQLTDVEVINATNIADALDLHRQSDGFIITGGLGAINGLTLTGSAGADTITAGSGFDTINGFVGADTVNGGENLTNTDIDTLALAITSTDLNSAADTALVNVEAVKLTAEGVTVNLGKQSEAFTITGSTGVDIITAGAGNDTITGGPGGDTINAGGGDDIINNFIGADHVDGGAGTADTLVLNTTTDLATATDGQLTDVEVINATNIADALDLHRQSDGFIITGGLGAINGLTLTGSAGADTITAGSGFDIVTGGRGNDIINGGSGTDTAIFSGNRADYAITLSGSTYTIVDTRSGVGSDGTDAVTNVENFQFANGTFTTATLDATLPTVSSVAYGSHDGTLKAGETVTVIVTFSENVTVAGGTPTLVLNSGGTAPLTGGSGTTALTFSYTVASGHTTPDLAVTALNLNGATITDAQGNIADTTGAVTNPTGVLVVDTTAPTAGTLALANFTDSGASSSDHVSSDSTFDLSLTGQESGATVVYERSTNGGSTWTPTTTAQTTLADGSYQFRAQVTDLAGNTSTSNIVSVTVDTTAPTAGTLALANFTDSGASSSDRVSSDSTFDLSLTGQESGATVVYERSTNGGSTWTPTTAAQNTLVDGNYQFRAQVTDLAGNTSTSNIVSVTVDTTAPATPTVDALSTSDTTPVLSGTATLGAGEQLTVTVNGATYSNVPVTSGAWSLNTDTATPSSGTLGAFVPNTTYSVTATVTDTAGNATSDATANELVITAPPTVSSVTYGRHDGTVKAGETVTLVVTFSETVTVAGGTPSLTLTSGGTATFTSGSGTTALTFSYTVASGHNTPDLAVTAFHLNGATVQDAQGNPADTTGAITNPPGVLVVDTIAPAAGTLALAAFTDSGTSNNDFISTDHTFNLSLTGQESGATVVYERSTNGGSTWTPTTAAQNTLVDGNYQFRAQVTDLAGNTSTSNIVSVTVDTTAPATPTVDALSTSDTTPVLSGTATLGAGEQLTVTVNGATYSNVPVTSGAWSLNTDTATPSSGTLGAFVPNTTYSVTATVTDLAGNATSDATANELVITGPVPTTTAKITNLTETTANSADSTSLTLSGVLSAALGAGEMVRVSDNGTTIPGNLMVSGTTWSFATDSTMAGSHTFTVVVANATSQSAPSSVSVLAGTTGNNNGGAALTGTSAGEYIFGFAGTDTINGFVGADTVNGGEGDDTLALATTSTALNNADDGRLEKVEFVSLTGAAAGVTLNLIKQKEAFTITGGSGADTITGGSGADTITGGSGADMITGGDGVDTLNGETGGDRFIGGAGPDIINLGVFDDNVQDRVQFFKTSEFGDTVSNFDSTGISGQVDLVDFGGSLRIAFDDINGANGKIDWVTGNAVNGGNTNANLNTTREALYLAGTKDEGVEDISLLAKNTVAAEFNAEFTITASNGQDALLVVNATNSTRFAVYSYLESGSVSDEIQDVELTLIGVFNSNGDVGTSQFGLI